MDGDRQGVRTAPELESVVVAHAGTIARTAMPGDTFSRRPGPNPRARSQLRDHC
jgi:hypothetical protein